MKKHIYRIILLALCVILALPTAIFAAPVSSQNAGNENYTAWYRPVYSYLYVNSSGGLTRVEYIPGTGVVVEDYDSAFSLKNTRTIELELSKFGGFYAGSSYNFLIEGENNPDDYDGAEVVRVIKYSKTWQRLGQATLRGANTYSPFAFGSLDCAEAKGMLYIRTCHEMYKSSDGYHHQACMTMAVRQSDMAMTYSFYKVSSGGGYVSHSFNQCIVAASNGDLMAADHGDAYPRGIIMSRFTGAAGKETISSNTDRIVVNCVGAVGDNNTGTSLGGLVETSSGYLVAFNQDNQDGSFSTPRNVGVAFANKALTSSSITWLTTKYNTGAGKSYASTPRILKVSDNRYMVIWEVMYGSSSTQKIEYIFVDGNGKKLTNAYTQDGMLSDCRPILYNGKATWYVTNGDGQVRFYTVTPMGVYSTRWADTSLSGLRAVNAGKKRVILNWNATEDADCYLIYGQKNNKYQYVGVTTVTYYVDNAALDDQYNFYWVFPCIKDKSTGKMYPGGCPKYVYAKGICPAVKNFTATSVRGGVKLSWSKTDTADGYLVYKKTSSGQYHYLGMYSGTSVTDKKASKTEYNFYWIFAYHKDSKGNIVVGDGSDYKYAKAK